MLRYALELGCEKCTQASGTTVQSCAIAVSYFSLLHTPLVRWGQLRSSECCTVSVISG
ncbi:hypothetical protein CC80DRAFT_160695 [Byssothecium circinans]|uniref:Uncharacterized protein n=1 Tax=Byssothecium circinans TaxID=147558 RepID=A0A6A5UB85_9PLEO|nr:hypothetical protein CC80DRAFT_160695 [Byssothecium circinans]